MTRLDLMNSACLYLEIGQSSLKALHGNDGLELTLERLENGRLTVPCKERLTLSLRDFLQKKNWQPRLGAFCAVGARGVSLRRMTLPATTKEGLLQLLRLQIEREFPLSPDELAWGYRSLESQGHTPTPSTGQQELVVVAVKKEVIEDYSEFLAGCGVSPVFTLAALARNYLCPHAPNSHVVLEIGRNHSELVSFENGAPVSLRILSWGGETITQAICEKLKISRDEAEKLKIGLDQETVSTRELGPLVQNAVSGALDSLAAAIKSNWSGQKIYLSGKSARQKDIAAQLSQALSGRVQCERLDVMPGEGRSAAILGLKKAGEQEGAASILTIQAKEARGVVRMARPAPWKWATVAGLLLVGVFLFPFGEALLMKPRLAKKLAEINDAKGKLSTIDQELDFLQYLKLNQPPYVDAAYALANAAPGGMRIEALSMNHAGDVSLRGSMMNSQQVVDFRSKLIKSGFFSIVTVEEQTPTPDRQKVIVRITAQWKPASVRESLSIGPSAQELEKAKAASKEKKAGLQPAMNLGMPAGMVLPPGFSPPSGDE
jgi:Tfp pilus assembly PilM family ATPase/Tfp pilus assembly protein PilN